MILRLQKAIRLGRISPDRVAVLHVEKNGSGSSIVRRLRLNDRGEFIDEWPGGFFDERIDELFGE
jgi:predicted ATPase